MGFIKSADFNARPCYSSRGSAIAGNGAETGNVEIAALVELHVPGVANELNLRLESKEVIVVPVIATLKEVLIASVGRILVV